MDKDKVEFHLLCFNSCLLEYFRSISTTLNSIKRVVSFIAYAFDTILFSRYKASPIENFKSLSNLFKSLSITVKKIAYFSG